MKKELISEIEAELAINNDIVYIYDPGMHLGFGNGGLPIRLHKNRINDLDVLETSSDGLISVVDYDDFSEDTFIVNKLFN